MSYVLLTGQNAKNDVILEAIHIVKYFFALILIMVTRLEMTFSIKRKQAKVDFFFCNT